MAKFQHSLYQQAKRTKAFLIYAEPDALGKRRSMAVIGQMVGASATAVAYWKRTDEWDNKLLASIEEQLADAQKTSLDIRKTLREGLGRHIATLGRLITDTKLPADKINAIKAYVHVCKELEVLKPDMGIQADLAPPPNFKDDISHEPQPVADHQGVAGEGATAGGPSAPGGEPADPGNGLSDLAANHIPGPGDDPVGPGPGDDLEHLFRAAGL